MADVEPQSVQRAKKKGDRSPSFPAITLTKAMEKVGALYAAAKRHEMRIGDVASAWGTGAKSSGTQQSIAALIGFGLVEDSGSGAARKFKVTDLAFKALEDLRPGAKEGALAEAALMPRLIAEYAQKWSDGRPADGICTSELRIDRGFTEDGAKSFLRVFDDAIGYTYPPKSDNKTDANGDGGEVEPPNPRLAVGDWVCVESGGQVVFEKTRVRAIEGPWVFVEASQSGSKMSDVRLLEKGCASSAETPPVLPFAPSQDAKAVDGEEMDRFTVDEGVVKIIFPSGMTPDSVDELEQFLSLFIKKAKRRAGAQKAD